MKNTFGELNHRLAEERMYALEDIATGTLKTKKRKKRQMKQKRMSNEMWNNYKICNIRVVGILEEEGERKKIFFESSD